ncbi:hypothetical protein F2P81_003081 [Scophthalmus maximus]|uniref:Uncharacterized protein n=1 Tax=Scophthalmus maximus TaxID=52904 RepID=A0A6A4TD62_SCOMX|nr:hypothetical protein F2P81_003081 [Scophthalmus maximus]
MFRSRSGAEPLATSGYRAAKATKKKVLSQGVVGYQSPRLEDWKQQKKKQRQQQQKKTKKKKKKMAAEGIFGPASGNGAAPFVTFGGRR